ncbi:MAG TPA: anthranilate phosphoribosyltransferase [Dermatophilaceae bacterium]|nr:anthranilate phosphoribosyltransferase [Dermatophilaceae bacterium]
MTTSAPAAASPGGGAASWPDLITALIGRRDLTLDEARWAMSAVMSGEASPVQLAGFLVALRAKGETVGELRGLADAMLEHAHRIEVPGDSIDVVGTGGDRANTVNISTMSAIVVAATGLQVVKHGNRAASSASGSADVLEALGVTLGLTPAQVVEVAERAGITFCFAQTFHPSMRYAGQARRELGVATAFNVLGPLTNPAQPRFAAIGVADPRVAPLLAGVFAERGKDAVVVRGDDGLDELTLSTTSTTWWVRGGDVAVLTIAPEDVGLQRSPIEALRGADAEHNAGVARSVLAGEQSAARDAVLLNAGAALAVATLAAQPADPVRGAETGRTPGPGRTAEPGHERLLEAVRDGVRRAGQAIDSGSAATVLERWATVTRELAG